MTGKSKEPVSAGSSQRALDNDKVSSLCIYYSKKPAKNHIENEKALPQSKAFSEIGGLSKLSLARKQAENKSCLSPCHILTQKEQELLPSIEFLPDGSLATISRQKVIKYCGLCGTPFSVPEWKAERLALCGECRQPEGMRTRGSITTFSKRSRRRLQFLVNSIRNDVKPIFCTMTFSDSYPNFDNPHEIKEALREFGMRFVRRFPKGSFVWRLETIERKSGVFKGRVLPHFHLLIFGISISEYRTFFAQAWHEVAGFGDPKHLRVTSHPKSCELMASKRQLSAYVSKGMGRVASPELSKAIQAKGFFMGRWWGLFSRNAFVFFQAIKKALKITERQAVELIRIFRKYAKIRGRSLSKFSVFIDGKFLNERLPELLAIGG